MSTSTTTSANSLPGQTLYSHTYILLPDSSGVGESTRNSQARDLRRRRSASRRKTTLRRSAPAPYGLEALSDTPTRVHLHWQAVPGATGYEVFSTPDLDTEFAATPDAASATASGELLTSPLSSTATDAYLESTNGLTRFYAVSAIVSGHPTVESQAVEASAGEPVAALPELGRCMAVTSVKEGTKTVYHGSYTDTNAPKPVRPKLASTNGRAGAGPAKHFTATLASTTLETVKKVKVKCTSGTSTGEITGARSLIDVTDPDRLRTRRAQSQMPDRSCCGRRNPQLHA